MAWDGLEHYLISGVGVPAMKDTVLEIFTKESISWGLRTRYISMLMMMSFTVVVTVWALAVIGNEFIDILNRNQTPFDNQSF